MRRKANSAATLILLLVMLVSASGCAAGPFPELPSPEIYAAAESDHSDITEAEEISIETILPAPETVVVQTLQEDEIEQLPAETVDVEAVYAEEPEKTDEQAETDAQEPEPPPVIEETSTQPALIIQYQEPEPQQVIGPFLQPVQEEPQTQPAVVEPEPQITVPQPDTPSVNAEAVRPLVLEKPVITLSGETLPANMTEGNSFVLRGVIRASAGNLIKIHAALVDSSGKSVQQCIYAPGTDVFDLENTVNVSLVFGTLAPGNYTYLLNAEASNEGLRSESELINREFTVSADPAREAERDKVYAARFTNDTSNAGRIWNRFINEFGNPYAAAAILGNIAAESSFVPYLVEGDSSAGHSFSKEYTAQADSGAISRDVFAEAPDEEHGGGYGICQWTAGRKGNLYDFARSSGRSVGDLDMQCDFMVYEMLSCYTDLYDYLRNADSCYSAVYKFCNVYEQAAVYGSRNAYALQYLEKYGA